MFNDRGGVVSEGDLEHVRSAKRDLSQQLLLGRAHRAMRPFGARSAAPTDNVVGIGIGERVAQGRPTGELGLRLLIRPTEQSGDLSPEWEADEEAERRGAPRRRGEALELSSGHFGLDSLLEFETTSTVAIRKPDMSISAAKAVPGPAGPGMVAT